IRQRPATTLCPYTTLFRSLAVDDREVDALERTGARERLCLGLDAGVLLDRFREALRVREALLRGAELDRRCEDADRDLRRGRLRSEEHTSELQSLTRLVCR